MSGRGYRCPDCDVEIAARDCPLCGGAGKGPESEPGGCPDCGGSGLVGMQCERCWRRFYDTSVLIPF